MPFSGKTHGYTLVELLVSIAIIAILSAVFVTGLNQQKNISLARRAAEKTGNDLQSMQNNALSGQTFSGARPNGFGIFFNNTAATKGGYREYADTNGNFIYDGVAEQVQQIVFDPTVELTCLKVSGPSGQKDAVAQLYVDYSVPDARLNITTATPAVAYTPVDGTVIVKNTRLNVCYSVSIVAASGTVSSKALANCSSPCP